MREKDTGTIATKGANTAEKSAPYNYDTVTNPALRAYLIQAEEIIKDIPDWPAMPTVFIRDHSHELGFKETYSYRKLLEDVRKRKIIDVTVKEGRHPAGTRYYFDKNQMRAFLALSWTLGLWRKQYKVFSITDKSVDAMVQETKLELGPHPLVQEIRDPQSIRREPKSRVVQPKKPPYVLISGNNRAGYKEPIRAPALQEWVRTKIPTISAKELEDLRNWDLDKIQQVLTRLPQDFEVISLDDFSTQRVNIPDYVIRVANFINVALGRQEELEKLSLDLEDFSYREVRRAFSSCLGRLQKHNKNIENLANLFQAIKITVGKNTGEIT